MSGYNLFFKLYYNKYKQNSKPSIIMNTISTEWNKLSSEEKQLWNMTDECLNSINNN